MNEEEKKAVKYFYNLRATIDESNMLFDEEINVKHGKETIKQITIILNLIEKLQKENKELKEENEYNKILLDMNNNFTIDKKTGIYKWNVIEIQKVKDKIEKYKKLSDKFYVKFLESDRYNTDIREKGIKCDAIILALEELIEEREEN